MFEEYRNKLINTIERCRNYNGTFLASPYVAYTKVWIRDTTLINTAYLYTDTNKYLQTCHTLLDFLKYYEYGLDHKLTWMAKDTDFSGDKGSRFLNPKVNVDGTEIGECWQNRQLDSICYYAISQFIAIKHGLNPFRDDVDRHMIQLIINIIEALDVTNKNYATAWEENEYVSCTNLLLCQEVLEKGYDYGFNIDREELRRIRRKVAGMFPMESHCRECDMTLLFPCIFTDTLKGIDIEDILSRVALNLNREYGVIRYKNDVYKPFISDMHCSDYRQPCKGEMQWLLGLGYESYIFSKLGHKSRAIEIINDIIDRFPDGKIPEGINEKDQCCLNTPLIWSCASFVNAIDAVNDRYI